MKILFVGGSGVISRAATLQTIAAGHELWLLNRGQRRPIEGARTIVADLADVGGVRNALRGHTWDVVVQWIAFAPADIRRDLELFRDTTRQYIFISSASVYQKPLSHYLITESTPRANPHWEYSRLKIACEQELEAAHQANGFPGVIVRPSLTYGDDQVPLVLNAWSQSWTLIDRLRRGATVIIPGDGTSLWTITHNTDFAQGLIGLFGLPATLGKRFTSRPTKCSPGTRSSGRRPRRPACGRRRSCTCRRTSSSRACRRWREPCWATRRCRPCLTTRSSSGSSPGSRPGLRFATGIRRTIAWFDADPARKQIDAATNDRWDRLTAAYEAACRQAREQFGGGKV
jgi:nucleoside-diphosphate-sugar epimerase